ncbi:hypothetical protein HMPREF1982_00288 [Clostridiales bacterium oral taxon 876 str. F0540]|nr:hypothetical protein HMPREF1982_00288 [Clostridiales bacterium oral taxon 876 str. F0540]
MKKRKFVVFSIFLSLSLLIAATGTIVPNGNEGQDPPILVNNQINIYNA